MHVAKTERVSSQLMYLLKNSQHDNHFFSLFVLSQSFSWYMHTRAYVYNKSGLVHFWSKLIHAHSLINSSSILNQTIFSFLLFFFFFCPTRLGLLLLHAFKLSSVLVFHLFLLRLVFFGCCFFSPARVLFSDCSPSASATMPALVNYRGTVVSLFLVFILGSWFVKI